MKYLRTIPNSGAGIGHQWMNWQLGAILANKWDLGFVHTPLISERSNGNWDNFLNFGSRYKTIDHLSELKVINLPKLDYGFDKSVDIGKQNLNHIARLIANGKDNTVYQFPRNTFPGIVSSKLYHIVDQLRNDYFDVNTPHDNGEFVASFHLRRGDVSPIGNPNRWLENEYYIEWMYLIKEILDSHSISNYRFVLFSTSSNISDFSEYPDFVETRIDGDPYEDFDYMVNSDILFAGLSSFSIMAATLNPNFNFYCPLRTYCSWMEYHGNPYKLNYSNSYNKDVSKLKKWLQKNN